MPPPKGLSGELASEFSKLFGKVSARSVPLEGEAATKAVQNLTQQGSNPARIPLAPVSPELQVAFDELMEKGAKLEEVTGTGTPRWETGKGWVDQDAPLWLQRDSNNYDTTARPDMGPRVKAALPQFDRSSQDVGRTAQAAGAASSRIRQAGLSAELEYPAFAEARERTQAAIDENTAEGSVLRDPSMWSPESVQRGYANADARRAPNSRVGDWPRPWLLHENIPQVVGGAAALGAAAALAPGQAQAQSNEDLQLSDGRTMGAAQPRMQPKPPPLLARPDDMEPQLQQPGPVIPAPPRPVLDPELQAIGSIIGPGGSPTAAAEWAVGKFKKHLVDPVLQAAQGAARRAYENTIAPYQRASNPAMAVLGETAFRNVLGKTSFNVVDPEKDNPDALAPGAKAGHAKLTDLLGQKGGAAIVAGAWAGADLPFYLFNLNTGGAAKSAAVTNAVTEMMMPGGQPVMGAVTGGAIGQALESGLKAAAPKVAQLAGAIKNKLTKRVPIEPVALTPPDEVGKLVDGLLKTPEVPGNAGTEMAVVVHFGADGKPAATSVKVDDGGQLVRSPTKVPLKFKDNLVISPELIQTALTDSESQAAALLRAMTPERAGKAGEVTIGDWPTLEFQHEPEGFVLALKDGNTLEMMNLGTLNTQTELARARNLVRVKLPDGTSGWGYQTGGVTSSHPETGVPASADTYTVMAPDPAEGIEGALPADITVTAEQVTEPSTPELKDILRKAAARREEAQKAMEVAEVRAVADQQVAQADVALGGDGSGGKLPPPPPSDPPPPPPPNPHNVDPSEEIKLRWSETALGGAYAKIQRKLLNPTVRGPQDLADLAFVSHSVDAFQRIAPDTLRQLQKTVPELAKLPPSKQRIVQQDISRYITGEIELETLRRAHPELNHQLANSLEAHKAQIAADEAKLIELGMVAPDARSREAELLTMPEFELDYAVRMHWRYLMPKGEWYRLKSKDEAWMNQMTKKIRDAEYPGGGPENLARAKTHLNYLLGDPKLDTPVNRAKYGAGAKGSLKERETMPAWKAEALGPVPGMFRVAETRARQKQLIVLGEMFKSAAENRNLAVRGDDPFAEQLGYTVHVPQDRRYGLLAGMKVKPEAWEALVEAPQAQRNASHWIRSVSNFMKYNQTVANPGSWVTNFLANMQGAALSNLINPWAAPTKLGNGMRLFTQDLKAFKAAPGVKGPVPSSMVAETGAVGRARFERAMELGIIASDYSSAEFHTAASDWARIIDAEVKQRGTFNPLNVLSHAGNAKDWLAKKYGAIDSLWKYATYTAGLQKAGFDLNTGELNEAKAIKFLTPSYVQQVWHGPDRAMFLTRYRPGMSGAELRRQVELEVAQRIHYSFPMLDRVGEGVASVGQYGGTAINPYLKIKTELMRNYAQLPARALREPGMLLNLMSYAATVAGIYYGIRELRAENGVNQEEVDQSFMAAPPAVKRFKPGAMAMWRRTDDGRLTYVDLTSLWEPFSWLQGDPNAASSTRFLTNLAMTPIDGSLVDPEVAALLNQSGILNSPTFTQEHPEWQQGGALLTQKLMERTLPGLLRNTYTTAARGGLGFAPRGRNAPDEVPQTPLTTGLNMVLGPNRVFETGSRADKKRAIQLSGQEIDRAAAEIDRIGQMNEGQSTNTFSLPLDKKAAIQKAKDVQNEKEKQHKQLKKDLGR